MSIVSMSDSLAIQVFTTLMASLHLLAFIFSLITNYLASDFASSASKVDQKSKLFRRLTVLQCHIAQFHNLWRIPMIFRLFYWDWDIDFVHEVINIDGYCLTSHYKSKPFPMPQNYCSLASRSPTIIKYTEYSIAFFI